MSLSPITDPQKVKEVIAYDLEWWPDSTELRLVGVYDRRRGYRGYLSVAEFLEGELSKRSHGATFFAHAGGTFDVQFILSELVKRSDYQVTANFSGSAAVSVTVKRGRMKWTFADSYFLLRDSLKKIGTSVGIEKGEGEDAFEASMSILRAYNERDCLILWTAINRLQEELLGMGGELRATIASCAMVLFRRKFLTREIRLDDRANRAAREAYIASRVEVIRGECGRANYYDINSSFPASMKKAQPGNVIRMRHSIPEGAGSLYLAKCQVSIRECYLPPLGFRNEGDGRIYFPTGTWETWLDCADVSLLEESGCGRILRIDDVIEFEPFDDLAGYVEEVYSRKASATDPFRRLVYKYLLNALYGKFAEREEKRKILINPDCTYCRHNPPHANDGCLSMIMPGVWEQEEVVEVPHAHVPISAHVTASSRALLWEYMHEAADNGELYYVDTDSVVTTATMRSDAKELGALKLEKVVDEGRFISPKLYATRSPSDVRADDGKKGSDGAGEGWIVKSKGFRRLGIGEFRKLVEGDAVEVERFSSIRENLRDGHELDPYQKKFEKRLRKGVIRPKRCDDGNNNTRPWGVGEIEE